jgi:hypothetical protein
MTSLNVQLTVLYTEQHPLHTYVFYTAVSTLCRFKTTDFDVLLPFLSLSLEKTTPSTVPVSLTFPQ